MAAPLRMTTHDFPVPWSSASLKRLLRFFHPLKENAPPFPGLKKAVHKTTTTDDKRLQSTLKRIGVNPIPAIEEVNIFKDDTVIQFQNPKVQASIAANTWVVSGSPQTKKLQDLLPSILSHLGSDNLDNLKRIAEQFQKQTPASASATGTGANHLEEDDDDVPELVHGETFEEAADETKIAAP